MHRDHGKFFWSVLRVCVPLSFICVQTFNIFLTFHIALAKHFRMILNRCDSSIHMCFIDIEGNF